MIPMTDEAVTRDHWEADSSKLGPNLEGIQSTVITKGENRVYYNLVLENESKCLVEKPIFEVISH